MRKAPLPKTEPFKCFTSVPRIVGYLHSYLTSWRHKLRRVTTFIIANSQRASAADFIFFKSVLYRRRSQGGAGGCASQNFDNI